MHITVPVRLRWYQTLFHPNVLTALRMALIVPILALWDAGIPGWPLWLFCFAAILDLFDGYLARRWGLVTPIGKVLDPVADKLLLVVPIWLLIDQVRPHPVTGAAAALLVAVEVSLLAVRFPKLARRFPWLTVSNPAANGFGKVKVWVQSFVVGCLLYDDMLWTAAEIGVHVATAFALLSAITKHPRMIASPLVEKALNRPLIRGVIWRFAAG